VLCLNSKTAICATCREKKQGKCMKFGLSEGCLARPKNAFFSTREIYFSKLAKKIV